MSVMDRLLDKFTTKDAKGYRSCTGYLGSRGVYIQESKGEPYLLEIPFNVQTGKRASSTINVQFTDKEVKIISIDGKARLTQDDATRIASVYATIARMYDKMRTQSIVLPPQR